MYTSALFDIIESKKNTRNQLCFENVIQLVLPIGWITTGANFYLVLKSLEDWNIPKGNLTIELTKDLLDMGSAITSGAGPHTHPYVNIDIPIE